MVFGGLRVNGVSPSKMVYQAVIAAPKGALRGRGWIDYAGGMENWPVSRNWTVQGPSGKREDRASEELRAFRALALCGPAGSGKTHELNRLAELDKADGLDVRVERLIIYGQSPEGLRQRLQQLSDSSSDKTILYLDALDEVMLPVRTAGLVLSAWIREHLAKTKPTLRLSCRSTVWPDDVTEASGDVYGKSDFNIATIESLSDEQIGNAAQAEGANGDDFLRALRAAGARVLAGSPLNLKMLLELWKTNRSLPKSRADLFARSVERLAREPSQRRSVGSDPGTPVGTLLEQAERLACIALLSGRERFDLGENPPADCVGIAEVESLPAGGSQLSFDVLNHLRRTGLFEADGTEGFRFVHRQYAEYLAGRRLASLLPHQSRALLASELGWRAGVGGPLREVAAFTAIHSKDVASWIAESDPEVIGLSDVADPALRRTATLAVLDMIRRKELNEVRAGWDDGVLLGFQYPKAERDFQPILQERSAASEDVIDGAIDLIRAWRLVEMSDALADVALDQSAPLGVRKGAAHALHTMGSKAAKRRLLPLIDADADDPQWDLKGIALRCNWPEGLTTPQLLKVLGGSPSRSYYGSYEWFLSELDRSGFDAAGDRLLGIKWAKTLPARDREFDAASNIVRRIAWAALDETDDPRMCAALAELLLQRARQHHHTPLSRIRKPDGSAEADDSDEESPLKSRPDARRRLLDCLAQTCKEVHELWSAGFSIPGFYNNDDFDWLLRRAVDTSLNLQHRTNLASIAERLGWRDEPGRIETWLQFRETEPVCSVFKDLVSVDLDSTEAGLQRKAHAEWKRWQRKPRRKRLVPPPHVRVADTLALAETKDVLFFGNLCRELTLEEYSTHYGHSRIISNTPGWKAADTGTRDRILMVAKKLLDESSTQPALRRDEPMNIIQTAWMAAVWLIQALDPSWLDARPESWWSHWEWYFLCEMHPNLHGEPEEIKQELLERLHRRATEKVRTSIVDWATSTEEDEKGVVAPLLRMMDEIPDAALDTALCAKLSSGKIPADRVGAVASFVLARSQEQAMSACTTLLAPGGDKANDDVAVTSAVSLLEVGGDAGWAAVAGLLKTRGDLGARILGSFAMQMRMFGRRDSQSKTPWMTPTQVGEVIDWLMEFFPPETDVHHDGAYAVGPGEAAPMFRSQLFNWLSERNDLEAMEAIIRLEKKWAPKYPWITRFRIRAQQGFRRSRWAGLPPESIAKTLALVARRVIRSEQDAADGAAFAVEEFGRCLRVGISSALEDLWNTPKKKRPTPKDEDTVSRKVCAAIADYFRGYAVTSHREVQIRRRLSSRSLKGAPGSELDVLVDVSPIGTSAQSRITLPVEVKRAHNPEARTALREQLVERYMKELGAQSGLYVVAWMGKRTKSGGPPSLWGSAQETQAELDEQANQLRNDSGGAVNVWVVVIDASLPSANRSQKVRHRRVRTEGRSRKKAARVRTNTQARFRKQRGSSGRAGGVRKRAKIGRSSPRRKRR